jgi:Bacterial membrane protein YfhO
MKQSSSLAAVVAVFAAVGLAAFFWLPLFSGGGFIGGDVYSYYLPQKVVFAEHLRNAELPLWNDRAGHGYPIVGESQTGAFYPLNVLLYRTLGVNAAYNWNHLIHYGLAFFFTWLYARAIGLCAWSSGLTALTFVYAWFPSRCCWEWAIVGGAWMPAAFWCVEQFLNTLRWRHLIGLTAVLTLQLLAGHFNLAFLTLLAIVPYVALRVLFVGPQAPQMSSRSRAARVLLPLAAAACSFGLAAVQLAPTWELKQHSQRESPGPSHRLEQGSIPVWYWSQAVRPWYWYSVQTDRDAALRASEAELGAPTNQVEAQLYFGLIPLMLAAAEIFSAIRARDRISLIWIALAVAALLYTPGWLLVVTRHIPGFDFFQDPGRYGVITTLGVAVLAGKSLDRLRSTGALWLALALLIGFVAASWTALTLTSQAEGLAATIDYSNPFVLGGISISSGAVSGLMLVGLIAIVLAIAARYVRRTPEQSQPPQIGPIVFTVCALVATALDLWLVSRVVTYSLMVADPPINHLQESPVRKSLAARGGTARVYAPYSNLGTVLGAAATPVYLTFGPAAYDDPKLKMPGNGSKRADQVAWMRRAGVTHILSFEPPEQLGYPARVIWSGFDPLLNPAMGRYNEPFYLSELEGSRGRVAWEHPDARQTAKITDYRSDRVTAQTDAATGGRLIVTDLMYPGWQVAIDGTPAEALTVDEMFRGIDVPAGSHTIVWSYHPRSLYWGLGVSIATFVLLAAVAHVRYWHPQRLAFLDPARLP